MCNARDGIGELSFQTGCANTSGGSSGDEVVSYPVDLGRELSSFHGWEIRVVDGGVDAQIHSGRLCESDGLHDVLVTVGDVSVGYARLRAEIG